MTVSTREITAELSSTCPAASEACFSSRLPRNCAQMIHPPVETAVNRNSTSLLMESTQETPDTAVLPTFETISVSIVPIKDVSTCSMIRGMRSFRRSLLVNIVVVVSCCSLYGKPDGCILWW